MRLRVLLLIGAVTVILIGVAVLVISAGRPEPRHRAQLQRTADEIAAPPGFGGTQSLTVRLQAASGEALAGTVCLECSRAAPSRPSCAMTDSSGIAVLDPLPGRCLVHGSAPRFVPESKVVQVSGTRASTLDLVLSSGSDGANVEGVVSTYPTGTPLEGTEVRLRDAAGNIASATTNRLGEFSLYAKRGVGHLSLSHPGYVPRHFALRAPESGLRIAMAISARLSGVVRLDDGMPPRGEMWVSVRGVGNAMRSSTEPVRADTDGHFEVEDLGPGTYRLSALGDQGSGELNEPMVLGPGEQRDGLEIRIARGFRVGGRVSLAGRLCEAAELQLRTLNSTRSARGIGDAVALAGVAPARYNVSVRCGSDNPWSSAPSLLVETTDILDQEWKAGLGVALHGTVKDGEGKAVSGVRVAARDGQDTDVMTDVDRDGHYELVGVHSGDVSVQVLEPKTNSTLAEASRRLREGTVETMNFVLSGGALRVEAKDDDGKQATGLSLLAKNTDTGSSTPGAESTAGTYEWRHLPPGSYEVSYTDGVNPERRNERDEPVAVATGKTALQRLVVASQNGRMTGTVQDGGRRGVQGATVELLGLECGGACLPREARSDARGTFAFARVNPRATFNVRARLPTGEEGTQGNVSADKPVVITILTVKTLKGVVAGASDSSTFRVTLLNEQTKVVNVASVAGREFSVPVRAGDDYVVRAQSSDGFGASKKVRADDAALRLGVTINIQAPASLKGRVASTVSGVDGVNVEIVSEGGAAVATVAQPGVPFELNSIPPGPAKLRAYGTRSGRLFVATMDVLLTSGAVTDVGDVTLLETPFSR